MPQSYIYIRLPSRREIGRLHETCDCFIELLSETKPEGLDCETVVYYIYDFPKECNLMRHSMTRLDESSNKLLSTFRVYIDKRLFKLREFINKDTFFSKEQVSYIKEYTLHPQSDVINILNYEYRRIEK